mgnify:CR=1 FL=1
MSVGRNDLEERTRDLNTIQATSARTSSAFFAAAAAFRGAEVPTAAKTGSAENESPDAHAWFAGFAPAEDPKIVVAVMLEFGEHGYMAARVASSAVSFYLKAATAELANTDLALGEVRRRELALHALLEPLRRAYRVVVIDFGMYTPEDANLADKRPEFLFVLAQAHELAGDTKAALAAIGEAAAFDNSDYKALVCVFLYGGNDYANTVVPYDAANYALYHQIRAGAAGEDPALVVAVRDTLNTDRFRVYSNADAIGVELGGALKNVIGEGADWWTAWNFDVQYLIPLARVQEAEGRRLAS